MSGKCPFVLGLTGSIGMGKSAVAAMFAGLDVPVFDAYAAVHELQGPEGALLPAIETAFPGTTGPDGVRRAELGAAVFGDAAALARLEAIVHPAVAAMRADFLKRHAVRNDCFLRQADDTYSPGVQALPVLLDIATRLPRFRVRL